jgi:dolichyl-phosphate beta-glucosyltransferase
MMLAHGETMLMVDADGATSIRDLERLLSSSAPVVFGSRHHLVDDAVAHRSALRTVLMFGFHTVVRCVVGGQAPQDTQCGFKTFRRDAARNIFGNLHLPRWAFDIEVVLLASQLRLGIEEVAVNWVEVPGSKLNIITASITMLRDMIATRLLYATGMWVAKKVN